jgi:hypothetical protein
MMIRASVTAAALLGFGVLTAAPAMADPTSTVSCSPPALCDAAQQAIGNWGTLPQRTATNWSTLPQRAATNWSTLPQRTANNYGQIGQQTVGNWSNLPSQTAQQIQSKLASGAG